MPFPAFRGLWFGVGASKINSRLLTGPSALFGMTRVVMGRAVFAELRRWPPLEH